jgi:hypothetical protein
MIVVFLRRLYRETCSGEIQMILPSSRGKFSGKVIAGVMGEGAKHRKYFGIGYNPYRTDD